MSDEPPVGSKRKEPPSPSTTDEEEQEDGNGRLSWRMAPEQSHSDWTIETASLSVDQKTTHSIYHVHKTALSVGPKRSEYFERLFQSDNFAEQQTRTSRIELDEVAAKAFPAMLDFLYSWDESPDISHENSVALHYLGRYFEIRSLRKQVRKFWKNEMESDMLGLYYEPSKIFRDEKAHKPIVQKVD